MSTCVGDIPCHKTNTDVHVLISLTIFLFNYKHIILYKTHLTLIMNHWVAQCEPTLMLFVNNI